MNRNRPLGSQRERSFAHRLLCWFDNHRRDLPWRRTSDPWAIWVSEVMLQQTRVDVVRDSYGKFMRDYPTAADWARVDDTELLQAWRGLGYYRRARLLREGARRVVAEHGGAVPAEPDALESLPGIGSYTRGAIASIAFGHPELAVDGNVERVVARHRAIRNDIKRAQGQRQVRGAVREWMDPARAGDFNQALMELGAVVCTPTTPGCDGCPVRSDCQGRRRGLLQELPRRPERRRPIDVQARAVWLPTAEGLLAHRIPSGEVNAGQIELPGPGLLQPLPDDDALAGALATRFGASVEVGPVLASIRHGITHHRITWTVHFAALVGDQGSLIAVPPDVEAAPWTTASRKVFKKLASGAPPWHERGTAAILPPPNAAAE